MKRTLLFALSSILFIFSHIVCAKSIDPTLKLINIKSISTMEKRGDEVYMMVTVYPSDDKPKHYHIPKTPLYWPSEHLDKIKLLNIWHAEIKKDQAVTLILSLMDRDAPPWNTDDLIGEIKVQLKNNKGELESTWSLPNRTDPPITVMSKYGEARKFELMNDGGKYELYLVLK